MRILGFVFIFLLLISCDDSSSVTEELMVDFTATELQTDTQYLIEVTHAELLDNTNDIGLRALTVNGEEVTSYELIYETKLEASKILIQYQLLRKNSIMGQNKPVLLELTLDTSSDSSEVFQHEAFVWDLPKIEELNMPQRGALVSDKTIDAIGEQGSVYFYWINLPPWSPPEDPTWEENPYGNISWKLYYHSLGWLTAYVELYERSENEIIRTTIDKYLKDYDTSFEDPFNPHIALAYREDAVSVRVNHLLYIYYKLYRSLPEEQREVIERLIDKDIQLLQVYLDDESWDNKNHGLIQARSALNLVATFPFYLDIENLKISAFRRISAASEQLFSPEGYVIEQSVGYHFIGISMMLEAKHQLDTFGMEPNVSLMNTLRKAITIAPYLLYHNGSTPSIGDTSYGQNRIGYLKRYYSEFGETIDELEFFLKSRHEKLDDLKIIKDEGVVIAKYNPADKKMSKVFFDVGKARLIHGHYDQLNVVGSLGGQPLLIDPGGPYTYSKAGGRDRWRYRSAHNMLIYDSDEIGDYSATLNAYHDNSNEVSASGTVQITKGIDHYRGFVLTKEQYPLLIVIDSVEQLLSSKLITEYWHFAPGTAINMLENNHSLLTVESGDTFHHYQISNGSNDCSIIEGKVDKNAVADIGWVTPGYNKLRSAPVIKCQINTSNYLKVNIFTEQNIEQQSTITQVGDDVVITVDGRVFNYSLIKNKFLN